MGHGAKILMPYIHALKDVVLRLYLIDLENRKTANMAVLFFNSM